MVITTSYNGTNKLSTQFVHVQDKPKTLGSEVKTLKSQGKKLSKKFKRLVDEPLAAYSVKNCKLYSLSFTAALSRWLQIAQQNGRDTCGARDERRYVTTTV